MTRRVKLISDDRTTWDEALALYREQLRFHLDYLVPCECDHQILAKIESEVRDRSVPDEFKLRFLSRTLVRNVIQHLRECNREKGTSHDSIEDPTNSAGAIPAQERLVYFMRDILEYSTRETSLLVGMTDAQVEKLLSFARKRIDMTEGPSSLEIQAPGWTYFRWKFHDLHLC
jgi:Sigma-70, region 4